MSAKPAAVSSGRAPVAKSPSKSPKKTGDLEREQRAYWDEYDRPFTTPFHMGVFMNLVPLNNESKILDLGCGYGRTLLELKAAGYEESNLFGLDISEIMIMRAQRVLPKANLKLKQGRKLPYEANTFDGVILLNLLCCIIPNTEQVRLIQEIRRVLKPNGVIYVNDFLISEDDLNLARYNEYKEAYAREDYDYPYGVFDTNNGVVLCRHHDPDWIRHLFSENFNMVEYTEMVLVDDQGETVKGFYCMVKKLPPVPPPDDKE